MKPEISCIICPCQETFITRKPPFIAAWNASPVITWSAPFCLPIYVDSHSKPDIQSWFVITKAARMDKLPSSRFSCRPPSNTVFSITFEYRLERLLLFPFRVLGRKCLDAIEGKGELEIHRLFRPQAPIVVEYRNALRRLNKTRAARGGYFLHKPGDGLLACAVIPGRQRISIPGIHQATGKKQEEAEGACVN